MLFQCFVIVPLLFGIFYLYSKYKLSYWQKRGVKVPVNSNLIFGNFTDTLTFKKPPGKVLQDIYESVNSEPYVGFYIFHKPILMIRDLKLIKQIMVKDFDIFSNRRFGGDYEIDSVGLINLLSIHQPGWKYLRSKMTPSLTGLKLKRMVPLMTNCTIPLVDFIERAKINNDGWKEFELKEISSRYTTDIISSIAFGISTNSFDEKNDGFWRAGQRILTGFKRGLVFLIFFFIPNLIGFVKPFCTEPAEFFRKVFWNSMNSREKLGTKRGDLIDSFLTLKNGEQSSEFKFEDDNLLGQALSFYIAGLEAVSSAIAFSLYELSRHTEYQSQLYEEIKIHLNNEELTLESINKMEFLDQVVNETLRLYPPLPMIDRIASKNYKLPGTDLIIEKNTPIYVSINGTNRDPRYFNNPDEFNPLRSKSAMQEISSSSLAFGLGPRSCIGQRIGQIITKVAIITILQKYKLSHKTRDDNLFSSINVFTTAADGVHVQFKKRND